MLPLVSRKQVEPLLLISHNCADLPGAPLARDVVKSGDGLTMLAAAVRIQSVSRILDAPPGAAEGRLKVLREAFDQAMKDPEMLEKAKQAKRELT